jgi:hypothetical protein
MVREFAAPSILVQLQRNKLTEQTLTRILVKGLGYSLYYPMKRVRFDRIFLV